MARALYIATLWLLQAALVWNVLPSAALTLQRAIPLGVSAPPLAAAQLFCAVLAVVGLTVTLGFPALAAMRHTQRGPQRFLGLPAWAVALALVGTMLFVAGTAAGFSALDGVVPHTFAADSLSAAGLALMSAGALAAELLRRSVRPQHRSPVWRTRVAPPVQAYGHEALPSRHSQPDFEETPWT